MCTIANAEKGTYNVVRYDEERGLACVVIAIDPADPYRSFTKLPAAIEFKGRVFGKSGYSSDTNLAYFRSDTKVAYAIRKGN